jgi:hypothetical protein
MDQVILSETRGSQRVNIFGFGAAARDQLGHDPAGCRSVLEPVAGKTGRADKIFEFRENADDRMVIRG